MSEVLDINGDLIAWMDDDYWQWTSRCESCPALGTGRCLHPDSAIKDTNKADLGCEYEYQCACCAKLDQPECPHFGYVNKETYVDDIDCLEEMWKLSKE